MQSDFFETLQEAVAWRDANAPARIKGGVKSNKSHNLEYHAKKNREYRQREKAKEAAKMHLCIMCLVPVPETLCTWCKTQVQAEAVEILAR